MLCSLLLQGEGAMELFSQTTDCRLLRLRILAASSNVSWLSAEEKTPLEKFGAMIGNAIDAVAGRKKRLRLLALSRSCAPWLRLSRWNKFRLKS
ncbi:MAG: hypothetical protein R3C49_20645 [Planctomycetaceae bacterium]